MRKRFDDMTTQDVISKLERFDFKLVSRADFDSATDVPDGLRSRAAEYRGAWIVYDPLDNAGGFMLIGDDKDPLVREALIHLDLPE